MGPRVIILVAFISTALAATVFARTWYVTVDGSGDAPTIAAAVDSSVSGDVILVGPGTYTTWIIDLKPNTSLIAELGPLATVLGPVDEAQSGILQAQDQCVVRGFSMLRVWQAAINTYGTEIEIDGNIIETPGVVVFGSAAIHHNLFLGGGDAIRILFSEAVTFVNNNIIVGRIAECGGTVLTYCNDVTVASACVSYGQTNFSLDPIFCSPSDHHLGASSPCAPGNHPNGFNDCGLIGPLPVGCGTVKTEQTTWGAVKALYRH